MEEETIIKYMMEKHYIKDKYVCWDFVRDIYKDMYDIDLPEYPVDEIQAEFKNKLTSNIPCIKTTDNPREGDVIVFSLFADQHAGVMVDNENFLHLRPQGVMLSNINNVGKNYVIYRKI